MVDKDQLAADEDKVSTNEALTSVRTKGVEIGTTLVVDPEHSWPELDSDRVGPFAYAAVIDMLGETMETTQFHLDADKLKGLPFAPPGRTLPAKKPLYTVKAIHLDGRLVQLPFEEQIQNTAGGDLADAIGLRRYQRRGIVILIDWDTLMPVYCPAYECWAKANPAYSGFCVPQHRALTLPNAFRGDDGAAKQQGLMESGVTTSRVWKG